MSVVDGTVEVAAAAEPLLDAVEAMLLPCARRRLGAQAVLEEVERAAGSQHPAHLAAAPGDVGDRAQRERAQRGVDRRVVEWEVRAVEADELDLAPVTRDTARADSLRPTADGSTA